MADTAWMAGKCEFREFRECNYTARFLVSRGRKHDAQKSCRNHLARTVELMEAGERRPVTVTILRPGPIPVVLDGTVSGVRASHMCFTAGASEVCVGFINQQGTMFDAETIPAGHSKVIAMRGASWVVRAVTEGT